MARQLETILRLLTPGLVFQGVIIGGGYATGRELVEFFLSYGALGGLLGLFVSTILWSAVLAVALNYAFIKKTYDYDSLLSSLLGRFKYLFEAIYFAMVLLVIAVISSAAGELITARTGASAYAGVIILTACVCTASFFSNAVISKFMVSWSALIYIAYGLIFTLSFMHSGTEITNNIKQGHIGSDWPIGALSYAGYNLAALPAILFTIQSLKNEKEARIAGILAGPIALLPAALFILVLIGYMPDILSETVPLTAVLHAISNGPLGIFLDIVIFGTFIQTGLGGMHAINERVSIACERNGRHLPQWGRVVIGLGTYAVSLGIGVNFGLIEIIANGYGVLTYGFLVLLVLPIMTIGLIRVFRHSKA